MAHIAAQCLGMGTGGTHLHLHASQSAAKKVACCLSPQTTGSRPFAFILESGKWFVCPGRPQMPPEAPGSFKNVEQNPTQKYVQ